jgi:hypothetical protein
MLLINKRTGAHTQTKSKHAKLSQRPYNSKEDNVFRQKCQSESTKTLCKFIEIIKHIQCNVTHKDETQMI